MKQHDPGVASTVYNQAALLASDVGLPDIARTICTQHANLYLRSAPLTHEAAIRALEPVVNLARLQVRAGQPDTARQHLSTLFDSVTHKQPAQIESVAIPADLVATDADRREVRTWLWTILLADGTRALTSAGRWNDALDHIQRHHGLAQRMLDGRQVAVLAALNDGATAHAQDLLTHTKPGEPWEAAVRDSLTVMSLRAADQEWHRPLQHLVTTYLDLPDVEGLTAFTTRFGLAVLDLLETPDAAAARQVMADLHRRAMWANDGYAAGDALSHPQSRRLASEQEFKNSQRLLNACALQSGTFPRELRDRIKDALRMSQRVIRENLDERIP
ncbi:hypothetical protein [Streptomyces sp. NBC_01477]|uniref:hypothetical protein n=1 Tax=Streptomyces sp. NBC_01477 TaxID=2976015 RepID=UPI002E345E0D|nr:hypothetical protein [Streptomyces sp. NBC_01477]